MALKRGKPLYDMQPMKAAPGRPSTNVGKYLVKPIGPTRSKTGFEMLNTTPEIIKAAETNYLRTGELPPALQPAMLRQPEIMRQQKNREISKGFVKPRSRMG